MTGVGDPQPRSEGQPAAPIGYYPPPPPPGRFTAFVHRLASRSPRWLAPLLPLVCLAGAVAYVSIWEPIDTADSPTTCLLKLTTGWDCPGCGGTRAFYFLLQGNLPAAARHHLVFVFAVPFLAYTYLAWAGNRVFRWRLPQLTISPVAVGVFAIAAGVFTVLRNLPWEPFTWFYV